MNDSFPPLATALMTKLMARTARVGIIGLGYVGLPLARTFAAAGYPVLGFDIDPAKVDLLYAGKSYLKHIPSSDVEAMLKQRFEATSGLDAPRGRVVRA